MQRPDGEPHTILSPDATEYDSSFVLKLISVPDEFFATYEPPAEVLNACPEPDPHEYGATSRSLNVDMYEYLERTNQNVADLSWVERFMLSRGSLPYSLIGRGVLACFIREATAEIRAKLQAEKYKAATEQGDELRVIRGLCVGEIVEDPQRIPGSKSGQKIAIVHVGTKIKDGKEVPDLRQIVCGGTDVLKKGHKVIVALPGALTEDARRVKAKRFKIDEARYKSQGVLCSENEARVFYDERIKKRDQVLILPDHPDLTPGLSLDETQLRTASDPYSERVIRLGRTFRSLSRFESFVDAAEQRGDPEAAAELLALARNGASRDEINNYFNRRFPGP